MFRNKTASMLKAALLAACIALLGACATVEPSDYANEKPSLDLQKYFNGTVDAAGVFQDRSGKVVKRFTVVMRCEWKGDIGTLDEAFTYSDGSTQRRVWTLRKVAPDRFIGTADDVIGEAVGSVAGNALRWQYVLALPVDGRVYHVDFDDWMFLMNDTVMLNRATMSKYGFRLGEVLLSFSRRP
ncbi:DUF3833 domain-containing protein [Noviherbaspirillum sp.]|uniref:DUF3833 domain-containing protein n=1 Tax=Noviherbaspirillum sp. TaxID=1926288 RepID=UPI002FE0B9D1